MRKSVAIAFAAVFCAAVTVSFASPQRRATLVVSGYTGGTTLANFPVLVRISPSRIGGFSYADCAADGSDISFVLEDDTPLAHEIDTWDTSGESLVWVKIPTLSGTRTSFVFKWKDNAPLQNAPAATWGDYIGVWHFSEAGGNAEDSTGHGLDAIEDAASASELAGESVIGGARLVTSAEATSTKNLHVPDFVPTYGGGTVFTASGWFKFPGLTANAYRSIINKKRTEGAAWNANPGWYLEMNNSLTSIGIICNGQNKPTTTIASVAQNWNHFAIVSTGSNVKLYINGVKKTDNNYTLVTSTVPMALMPSAGGIADEFRYLGSAVSADWVKAEYDAVSNASFLTYGEAVDLNTLIEVGAKDVEYGTVSPAYGLATSAVAGEDYVFTCTQPDVYVNQEETIRAICTGWKLYAVRDNELLRSSTDQGESATTFTHRFVAGQGLRVECR